VADCNANRLRCGALFHIVSRIYSCYRSLSLSFYEFQNCETINLNFNAIPTALDPCELTRLKSSTEKCSLRFFVIDYQWIYLPISMCLSNYDAIYASIYLTINLTISMYYLTMYLPIYLFLCTYLSTHPKALLPCRLSADMADDSQRIKALVIRAEDSRLMSDMASMRKAYTDLNILNSQLVGSIPFRRPNSSHFLILSTIAMYG